VEDFSFFVCVWLSSTLFQAKPFDFVAGFRGVENIMGGMPAFYWWQKEPFSVLCEMVPGKSLLVWQEVAAILCQSGQILMQMVTEWGDLGNGCKVLGLYFAKYLQAHEMLCFNSLLLLCFLCFKYFYFKVSTAVCVNKKSMTFSSFSPFLFFQCQGEFWGGRCYWKRVFCCNPL